MIGGRGETGLIEKGKQMKRKLMTLMTGLLLLCGLAAQAKMVVDYPTVASKPYTGSEQTPVVPESPEYYVLMASAGTGVGEYAIYLALTDFENTKWPDTDEEVGTMKWQITKAANAWTTEPSIASWTYGDPASTPTAVAKFGTPTVTFSGTAKDGTIYSDVTSVAKAGTYACKFTVAGTENYEGLDPVVRDFEIKVAVPGGGGGGSGNVNISVTGYDGPYDGSDHQIVVSITGEDAPTFSVGYSDAQNGPFQPMNSFKYKEIGTHTVWYCLQSANYATVTNSAVIKISKREINPPVVAPKAYNGGPQSADVSGTADYSVEYNGAFTDAGTHENAVILALKDSVHCKWANGAEDPVLLSFTITKSSGNAWMTEPSISGWKYGESAHVPVAVPKYGVVSVLYDGTTTDGQVITDATSVSKAGRYKAKFSVPETVSYNGLSANVEFAIERGTIDIGGGGTGGATLEVSNYSGTYDGDAHTASIAVTGDASSSFDLAYSLEEAGVYSPDKPTFSNACETTKIWYTVSSPDYQTVTNFATVAIGRRPVTFTSGSLSKKYDATPLVCFLVTVSGTFAKSEGFSFETTGAQTDVGTSKNSFSYSPMAGTLASNYAITKTEGDLEVTKRSMTLTSATASKKFNGAPLEAKTVFVTGDGWAGEESATYDVTGTQTTVGATQNTFTYALTNGAKEGNYTITKVEGILTVTQGDVVYTAQGYAAEYDGNGHSIAVNVTAPGGLVPKYALMPEGPYSATLPTFTNVCTDVVVWYALEADQYASVTNSAMVTIAKRPLTATMVNAIADQTYTGSEIKPPLTFTDEGNRMIAAEDYTATYSDNTVAGTASVKITGKRNYAGEVTVTFKIVKAAINGGDEPGGGSVPAGGVSKFDKAFEYDGKGHTIDAATILAAFKGAVVGGVAECKYALSATPTVWLSAPPVFTNVCTQSIWYKATAANYDDFIHEVRLTITARDIAKATIAPIPDVEFADKAATPMPVVTDGTPSIVTASDYTVSYLNNTQPGTATLTLTGKGNYKGTKSANFTIKSAGVKYAVLTGKLAWKLNLGSGCYTAQLKLTCTDGLEQGISQLRFIYQDRTSGSTITSALYDSSKRSYRPTAVYSGTTYRYVDIDATKITKKNAEVTFGVKDVSQPKGVVSASECLIELYVRSLASPLSDIGYVVWKSNGATCTLPISASGGSQGMTVQNNLKALKLAAKAPMCSAPLSTAALNTSLALGVVVDPASSPYCRLTDFAVGETGLRGRVEVGKETGGVETQGSLGTNARAVLMGSKNLSDGFSEIGNVPVDESGSFQFYLGSKDYQFFRVRIDIQNVVE